MEEKGGPAITVYEGKDDAYFNYLYVVNDEESAAYQASCEFSEVVGMTLLPPFKGEKYELNVKAGCKDMVIIKKGIRQFGYSKMFNEAVVLGNDELIQKAINEGKM